MDGAWIVVLIAIAGLVLWMARAAKAKRNGKVPKDDRVDVGTLLGRTDVLVLDTETTGFDRNAEVVEITIIDTTGAVRYDSLVMPRGSVPTGASDVHGLTKRVLRKEGARPWPEHHNEVVRLLTQARAVCTYNADYDERLLAQTAEGHGLSWPKLHIWGCIMLAYARHRGVPGKRPGEFRWHKLEKAMAHEGISYTGTAHRARADALATLEIMRRMARK